MVGRLEVEGERGQVRRERGEGEGKSKEETGIGSGGFLGGMLTICCAQRQTVVSQFYQLDRLVVEGQKTVGPPFFSSTLIVITLHLCITVLSSSSSTAYPALGSDSLFQGKQTGDSGDIVRQTTE